MLQLIYNFLSPCHSGAKNYIAIYQLPEHTFYIVRLPKQAAGRDACLLELFEEKVMADTNATLITDSRSETEFDHGLHNFITNVAAPVCPEYLQLQPSNTLHVARYTCLVRQEIQNNHFQLQYLEMSNGRVETLIIGTHNMRASFQVSSMWLSVSYQHPVFAVICVA